MTKLQPFEKLLTVLISGEPVTKDEIETKLGNDIYMYRLSTYIWHVKTIANGVVKSIKDGRIVKAYQLVNVDAVKKYLAVRGINPSEFVPGTSNKKVSVSKFTKFAADLGSSPLPATTPAPVAKVKVKPAKKAKVKPVVPKVDTTENLVDEVVEITD